MNWFLAKLVFQIRIGGFSDTQFDIQQRLVSAIDSGTAFDKARVIGRKEETNFLNEKNETVSWRFVGVSDLQALPVLHDGLQLDSSTVETEDPELFLFQVRQAEMLRQNANCYHD